MAGLLNAASASAQTAPAIVSTIGSRPSAATRVARVLETLAAHKGEEGWTYLSLPCASLERQLPATGPVAILTTPDCLKNFPNLQATTISGNVGFPAYFFAKASTTELQAGDTIGILLSDDAFRFRIRGALKMLWGLDVNVDSSSRDYPDLLAGLGQKFAAICVIDDDSGLSPARIHDLTRPQYSGARLVAEPLTIQRPMLPTRAEPDVRQDMTPLVVRSGLVDPPLGQPRRSGDESHVVVAFAAAPTEAAKALDTLNSAFARLVPKIGATVQAAEGPTHNPDPLPVVSPVLVTRGEVPAAVSESVRRALLAAPLDALINPCEPLSQQEMYRTFLRGAITAHGDDEVVLAALWEHAALLKTLGGSDAETHQREEDQVETLLPEQRREALVKAFAAASDHYECKAGMRAIFRGKKLAYYQRGVERLRDALTAPNINTVGDAFTEAAACLRRALNERHGHQPSCRESLLGMGMFTTYYAPYLPMAVIETEGRDAPIR